MGGDTQRQTCKMCGARQHFEFRVPDWLWEAVVPESYQRAALCLANVEFGKLSAMEIVEWAAAHEIDADEVVKEDKTLADLYALTRKPQVRAVAEKERMGFAR